MARANWNLTHRLASDCSPDLLRCQAWPVWVTELSWNLVSPCSAQTLVLGDPPLDGLQGDLFETSQFQSGLETVVAKSAAGSRETLRLVRLSHFLAQVPQCVFSVSRFAFSSNAVSLRPQRRTVVDHLAVLPLRGSKTQTVKGPFLAQVPQTGRTRSHLRLFTRQLSQDFCCILSLLNSGCQFRGT